MIYLLTRIYPGAGPIAGNVSVYDAWALEALLSAKHDKADLPKSSHDTLLN